MGVMKMESKWVRRYSLEWISERLDDEHGTEAVGRLIGIRVRWRRKGERLQAREVFI